MKKPTLIIITGRPASGKSTLAQLLSKEINYPVLSRDELKEGYFNTIGFKTNQNEEQINSHIYNAFFDLLKLYLLKDIYIIIEAAYQHPAWVKRIHALINKADIIVLNCKTDIAIAIDRFMVRISKQAGREIYHMDNTNFNAHQNTSIFNDQYEHLQLDVPTMDIETNRDFIPGLNEIVAFIQVKINAKKAIV